MLFSENVHTGVNFVEKIESCAMIRFIRVTYVRPLEDQIECMTMYSPPKGFGYKTFVPAAVKVGMCSGAPEYESLVDTWERAKSWLKCVGKYQLDPIQLMHQYNYLKIRNTFLLPHLG